MDQICNLKNLHEKETVKDKNNIGIDIIITTTYYIIFLKYS